MVAFSSTDRYSKNPGYLTVAGVLVSSSPLSELHPIVPQRLLSLTDLYTLANELVPIGALGLAGLADEQLGLLSEGTPDRNTGFLDFLAGLRINVFSDR